ncbi:metallophosphoesterase, partial [Candidatus Bipolaricaulota bacterium]|nr:metallophosphoesterase [Candidatus Bipolaricaulota bacterium]
GAPSEDSVTISWRSSASLPAWIEYSRLSDYESFRTFTGLLEIPRSESDVPETVHAILDNLDPDTEYVYRIVLDTTESEFVSPLGRFVTEPPPGEIIEFAILADSQWQWEGDNRLESVGDAIAVDETPFDFILHAGDVVESPASQYWDHWFSAFDDMLLKAPFIPVLGNHERNHRSYYDNFVLPPGAGRHEERWWALHWGDVVVVGLDTNVRQAADIMEQQEWARLHLSGPEPHKFVMFHHPVFSSDAFHGSGYSYDIIYHPIFVETGVDIVFNGHAHNYERIERDSVTYLVVGGGGAVPRGLAESLVEGSIVAIEGYNFYLRVTASVDGITVQTVSVAQAGEESFQPTDGRLLDSFSLPIRSTVLTSEARLLILLSIFGAAIGGFLLIRALNR